MIARARYKEDESIAIEDASFEVKFESVITYACQNSELPDLVIEAKVIELMTSATPTIYELP